MPSIHKRDGRPYWYAAFYTADGTRALKSTGTHDRKEAMRLCLEWAATAKEGREGRLSEYRARKVIADIFARANRESMPSGTVREYLDGWLAKKDLEIAESSMVQYRLAVNSLLDHLKVKSDKPIESITARDVSAFRDTLARRSSAATVNKAMKILGSAWRQARKDGLLDDVVFSRVDRVKGPESKRRPFTMAELGRILAVCDREWRGMVLFGYYTGARLFDLARMTWANIDLETAEVHFTMQKTGAPMNIPLAQPLRDYLIELPSSDDPSAPLFPNAYAVNRTGTLSNRFHDIMHSAGIVALREHQKEKDGRRAKRNISPVSFHSLRHTAASALRNHGVTDVVAMAILGHESPAVAQRYTKIDSSTLRRAVDALPAIVVSDEKPHGGKHEARTGKK